MTGGWNTFRDASKHKAIAATAAEELERPVVSHRAAIAPIDEPALEVHETTPSTAPILPPEDELPFEPGPDVEPEEDTAAHDEPQQDPDELIAAAVALMTPAWPGTPAAEKSSLRAAMKTNFKRVAPFYGLAVVPVAAAASLIAMRAGLNPLALCMQWWDLLFGSIFVSASALFLGISMWRGLKHAWMPAAPALGVLVLVTPLWVAASMAWGGASCAAGAAAASTTSVLASAAVPPLPPPQEVAPVWTVPLPQPRPPELHFKFSTDQLDLWTPEQAYLHKQNGLPQ